MLTGPEVSTGGLLSVPVVSMLVWIGNRLVRQRENKSNRKDQDRQQANHYELAFMARSSFSSECMDMGCTHYFWSTCFDIAIQAKGSVAKSDPKLSKPRKVAKTH